MSAPGGSNKAVVAAMLANLGIAIIKFIAFLITRSASMLAESVHSLADTGNQALLILGGKRAQREATEIHPFGFGRERYFWSFVVAIVLFSLGSLFAIYEAVHKIQHPEPLESPQWAIGVLLVAIVIEANSFRIAIIESRPIKGGSTWWEFIRTSKTPELPVVVLEDLGAMLGLVIALAAVSMNAITHNGIWDGYGSLVIGLLLGAIAIVLAIEMKGLLIGEAATPADTTAIEAALRSHPQVRDLIWLRTQHLGPTELLVAAKVEFEATLTMTALAAAIDEVEAAVRTAVPIARYLFIEPDVRRAVSNTP